jgi:hypothetical protein
LKTCAKPKTSDLCKQSPEAKQPASEVCKKIEKESDSLAKTIVEGLANSIPIVAIFNALRSKSESTQTLINKIALDIQTNTTAQQSSSCYNTTIQSQTNILKGGISPQCMRVLLAGKMPPKDILALQKSSRVSDVFQTNKAESTNSCEINLVLEALTKMDATIDNVILQKAMNKAKGLMSNSKSEQNICNDISTSMSACKYIEQTQCCSNLINQTQTNLVDSQCGVEIRNVIQNNSASAINSCQLDASSTVTDELSASIKNALSQTAKNTSEGLTLDFMIIFVIIGVAMFAAFVYCMKSMMDKALYILGAILIVAGIITMIVYFATGKPEKTRYNEPYAQCEGVKALKSSLDRSTFGKVKQRVKNSDVLGYDFYIDLNKEKDPEELPKDITPSQITDEQTGTVLYITVEPNDDCKFDPAGEPKDAVVSYIKTRRKKGLLICSIILIFGGIASIIGGVVKDSMTNSKKNIDSSASTRTDPTAKLKTMTDNLLNNPATKIPTKKV